MHAAFGWQLLVCIYFGPSLFLFFSPDAAWVLIAVRVAFNALLMSLNDRAYFLPLLRML